MSHISASRNESRSISVQIPAQFSFKETLSFLDRGFDECLYRVSDEKVSRLISFLDGDGILSVSQKGEALQVELQKEKVCDADLKSARAFVLQWFDLKRDISPFYERLVEHPVLSHFAKDYYGCRLLGIPDLFEAICWAIIGQQINLTFAHQVKRSLVEEYGERKVFAGQTYYSFPKPEKLATVSREKLRSLKFSRQKIEYLITVSKAFAENRMSKAILEDCGNKEEKIAKLIELKGIGIWTANYVLMKSLREMACITYGDAGLNKAIHILFGTGKKPSKNEIGEIFKNFGGWESYLNFYLWRSLG